MYDTSLPASKVTTGVRCENIVLEANVRLMLPLLGDKEDTPCNRVSDKCRKRADPKPDENECEGNRLTTSNSGRDVELALRDVRSCRRICSEANLRSLCVTAG